MNQSDSLEKGNTYTDVVMGGDEAELARMAVFTLMVGLSMAEVCSAHPTSGGPYFWSAMLSKPKDAPVASWITVCTFGTDYVPTPARTIGIYAAILVSQGLINTFGVHILKYLNNISVGWHALGTFSLAVAILAKAPTHQSGSFVFTTFIDQTGLDGVGWGARASHAYVAITGLLMAQYTLTGFDASAHMCEETSNAAMAGSVGIVTAIGMSSLLGFFLLLAVLFSIQDVTGTINSATGQPIAQVFLDTVGENGAIVLMTIVIGAMYFCGTFSVTSNSRMMYAFARDGAIPQFFHKVDEKRQSPIRTVWLACTLSFLLGLPSLGSAVAFSAATSIATIGLYISYGIPIALRVIYRKDFVRGPFHLGKLSYPIAFMSVAWIGFISIAFMLPTINPVNSQTLNYAVVAVGIVIFYSVGFWAFIGPIRQIQADPVESSPADSSPADASEDKLS
ncbi:hypothetical protein HWV62_12554 [Athelia sp. TMB]|nr:hypothetical protein HWV62_12554 [Athelia sp. TMB]